MMLLQTLMGAAGYAELVKYCDARVEAIRLTQAETAKRSLPLFVIHPATVAARK